MLIIQHYAVLPIVRHIWRQKMPILARYLIGSLAMNGSLVVMFWLSPNEDPGLALVWVTGCGGVATLFCYAVDRIVEEIAQGHEARELGKL